MIFEIEEKMDKFIEKIYSKSMKDLDEFFDIGWIRNTPFIFVVRDRKIIDKLRREKTEEWLVAWADSRSRIIYVLDRKKFEKESNHKYSKEEYSALIKHELCHLFFNILSKENYKPKWLNEGVAIYLSGQNKFKSPIKEFKEFLEFYDNSGGRIYYESGFFIELLVKKFGKTKLLMLIKSIKDVKTEKEFSRLFKKIYGFDLNYKEINKLLK